jgi:hypothetical protein
MRAADMVDVPADDFALIKAVANDIADAAYAIFLRERGDLRSEVYRDAFTDNLNRLADLAGYTLTPKPVAARSPMATAAADPDTPRGQPQPQSKHEAMK